jgi:hypothetical protein
MTPDPLSIIQNIAASQVRMRALLAELSALFGVADAGTQGQESGPAPLTGSGREAPEVPAQSATPS